jgi:hypothetical protein
MVFGGKSMDWVRVWNVEIDLKVKVNDRKILRIEWNK